MTHGSLFSGIGGFDLAAEWMGWENKFHCEWNEFGKRVLKYYWPEADSHDDITKTDFTKYNGTVELISGGFPCQPYSSAGKRLGKADDRHLWPHMLRAIKEVAPRWVVGENVRGLTNWNGGLVFEEVCADLENIGYQVAPYLIPACAVNAPHRRERIWFVAQNPLFSRCVHGESNQEGAEVRQFGDTCTGSADRIHLSKGNASDTDCDGFNECNGKYEIDSSERGINALNDLNANDEQGNAADTDNQRLQKRTITEWNHKKGWQESNGSIEQFASTSWKTYETNWRNFPTTEPTIRMRNDGISNQLDGITFSKWRNESIKAYGNAVVPQVVYQIFKAIEQYETTQRNTANRNR